MSDNDEPEANTTPVEPSVEPAQPADPAVAAAAAAAAEYKPDPTPPKGLSDTERADLEKVIESRVSKAVNDYRDKVATEMKEKEANGEILTREGVQELIAQERTRGEAASAAERFFLTEMTRLGITPGTDEYQKVSATFEKMNVNGNAIALISSEEGVRALAFAAGVIDTEPKQQEYIDLTTSSQYVDMKAEDIPEYARVDVEMQNDIQKALRGSGLA